MIPCGDKLLIKPDPIPETKPGGQIIIPKTTFAELVSGEVKHTHNGFYATDGTFVKSAFQPGDKVYYQVGQAVQAEVIPDLVLVQEAAILMREEREGLIPGEGMSCNCGQFPHAAECSSLLVGLEPGTK